MLFQSGFCPFKKRTRRRNNIPMNPLAVAKRLEDKGMYFRKIPMVPKINMADARERVA